MKKIVTLLASLLLVLMVFSDTTSAEQSTTEGKTLKFTGDPHFILGPLDEHSRPTYAHIQFHDFIDARSPKYKDPEKPINGSTGMRTDYLPGYLGNPSYVVEDLGNGRKHNKPVWQPRSLLSSSWTDVSYSNRARNFGLITTYADEGYDFEIGLKPGMLSYYEMKLSDWLADDSKKLDMIDYRIELIYEGDELVPRKIKLSYVGLTEKGKLKKIDLDGEETFDKRGIATVMIDNSAPNVTIDYKTGKTEGEIYVPPVVTPVEEIEIIEYEETVYVNWETGEYHYDIPFNASEPDKTIYYDEMSEDEAIEDGYYTLE